MGRKSKSKMLVLIILALVLINLTLMIGSYFVSKGSQDIKQAALAQKSTIDQPGNLSSILSLDGYLPVEIDLQTNLLLVKSGCKGIPMTPTEQQIRSIASAINNQTDFRPSAHDLMFQAFQNFDIEVLQAKIIEAEPSEEIYYARLTIKQGNKILNLDSKPSDAIAMALRAKIPIFIKSDIINTRGTNVCPSQPGK